MAGPSCGASTIAHMNSKRLIIPCAIALLAGCGSSEPESIGPVADLLLINADVVTVDPAIPNAEAIAIQGDRILAVGATEDVSQYRDDETEVIDLHGQMVIPGFIEGHGHYTSFGGSLMILDFRYAKSWAEIVTMVAEATADTPVGEWVIGRG